MANIQILDLELVQTEFAELSDMELETVVGGKERYAEVGADMNGPYVKVGIKW